MSSNENDILDEISLGESNIEVGTKVPKFEQELQKSGGNLSALAAAKKISNAALHKSPVESLEEHEEIPDNFFETAETADTASDEDADFIYGEDDGYDYTGSLDELSVSDIMLSDMDDMSASPKLEEMRTDNDVLANSLKSQMQADDLAIEMGEKPQIEEMSTIYGGEKSKEKVMEKEQLDRDEKELIKTRLKEAIESKPEGFDQKKSNAMYKKLMEEQRQKASKRGFRCLLITALISAAAGGLMLFAGFRIEEPPPLLQYLSYGALIFTVFMLLRSKFCGIISALYFIANTILIAYPCMKTYALDSDASSAGVDFLINVAILAAALVLCATAAIRLTLNKDIEMYYSYTANPDKNLPNRV